MLKVEEVKGFEKLTVNADMFRQFLNNFYEAWGLDARETIVPISVKYVKDKANGSYLRFDYMMYKRMCWLHVKAPRVWY